MDLRSMLAEIRGVPTPTPSWVKGEQETELAAARPPRLHLSVRRRVELAFPALVAYRLVGTLTPVGSEESSLVANARVVFNAVALESMDDLAIAERQPIMERAVQLRAWLIDPYANRGHDGLVVFYAFTRWLDDLRRRDVLRIAEDGAFVQCWDAIAGGICRHPDQAAALEDLGSAASQMATEWRRRLEGRGYYLDGAGG